MTRLGVPRTRRALRALTVGASATALVLLGAAPAGAQLADADSRLATRAQLEAAATTYEQLASSSVYGPRTRERARSTAGAIRSRLQTGDFRVGDQILLRIDGQITIDDTVTVREGPRITVRSLTDVALAGVLRSELNTAVTNAVATVFRTATVQARPTVRVAVLGEVTTTGYLYLVGDATIDQALTRAGGPTGAGSIEGTRIMRGDTLLMASDRVMAALAQGSTLDALKLRDGDAIIVPAKAAPWDRAASLQIVSLVLGPLVTLLLVR